MLKTVKGNYIKVNFYDRMVPLFIRLPSGNRHQAIAIRQSPSGNRHQAIAIRQSPSGNREIGGLRGVPRGALKRNGA
jgi:hypothetical protein